MENTDFPIRNLARFRGGAVIETMIEDARWKDLALDRLAQGAAVATLGHLGLDPEAWDIAVLGCDDARIAALNTEFRDKPSPTNVLSWPSEDRAPDLDGAVPLAPDAGPDPELGDIAISYDTCLREAVTGGIAPDHHVTHLLVHGILHLLGYDHIRDKDATLMERTEVEILGKMGVPDPY